jgi:DNA-binding response OmpR family regulator
MRPKKRILIASTDEQRSGELRFLLTIRAYAAHVARTAAEALERVDADGCDLLIVDLPFAGVDALLEHTGVQDRPPCVALRESNELTGDDPFDAVLPREYSPAELLGRVKVMSAHKRGPRKGTKKPVASVAAGAAMDLVVNL